MDGIHAIVVMGEDFPERKLALDLETGEVTLYVSRKVGEDEKLLQEAIEAAEQALLRREAAKRTVDDSRSKGD